MDMKNVNETRQCSYVEMKKPENLSTGQGRVLHRQTREIVYRVFCFISVIKAFLPQRGQDRVKEITEVATGVSHKTIQDIKNQYDIDGLASFHKPQKPTQHNQNPLKQAEERFVLDALCRTIYQ